MDDTLAALSWLEGSWRGVATGHPGRGAQERRYERILRGEFLMGTNRTVWEPTNEHPDGEIHEDVSVIGSDRGAGQLLMHVFYVERFIAAYRCERTADGVWVFTADRVTNGAPGMRARETFTRDGEAFTSRFELAMPGADFSVYTSETLGRA